MIVSIDGHSFNTDSLQISSHGHVVEIVETSNNLEALTYVEDELASDGNAFVLVLRKDTEYED